MPWDKTPLTRRMAEFVEAYLELGDAREAMIRVDGTKRNAAQHARELLADDRVQACIALGYVPADALGETPTIDEHYEGMRENRAEQGAADAQAAAEVAATYEGAQDGEEPTPDFILDKSRLLNRVSLIVDANIMDFFIDKGGKRGAAPNRPGRPRSRRVEMKRLQEVPRGLAYAISSLKVGADGKIEVRLYDKIQAMRLGAQMIGAIGLLDPADKPSQGEVTQPDMTLESRLSRYGNVLQLRRPKNSSGSDD